MKMGAEFDLHVASWDVAKLTRKKSRVILVAVALKTSDETQLNDSVHLQASSEEHHKYTNFSLPMQCQRPQLREWNHDYDDIQRGVNS
jgi:hypothetical protein